MNAVEDTTKTNPGKAKPAPQAKPKPPTMYHVVLLDDDDHTYDYVIGMLERLFGYTAEEAYLLAARVDTVGQVVVDTTTYERAEFKRDQIHAFGRDWRIPRCEGSMTARIEAAC